MKSASVVRQHALEQAGDGVYLLDAQGHITFENRAARRLRRREGSRGVTGHRFHHLWHEGERIDRLVAGAVAGRGGVAVGTSVCPDGHEIKLLLGATALSAGDSRDASVMVTLWEASPDEHGRSAPEGPSAEERRLRKELEEQKSLLKELGHRVVNNLAMLAALVEVKRFNSANPRDLAEIQQSIVAIRIVHEKLSRTGENKVVELADYIRDILQQVFSTFTRASVILEDDMDPVTVCANTAILVGLIVNEVATNAIKHAFSRAGEERFTVSLDYDSSTGDIRLGMANSGNPFPEEIEMGNTKTTGLRLIEALAEQLDGSVVLEKRPHTRFTVRFPYTP